MDKSGENDSIDYQKVFRTKHNSRFRNNPSATFGVSDREQEKKKFNDLGASLPQDKSAENDSVDYNKVFYTRHNSRISNPSSVDFGKAERGDLMKQANYMGSSRPMNMAEFGDSVDYNKVFYTKHNSRIPNPPSVDFGKSKRGDILKQANVLGSALPRQVGFVFNQARK